MADGRSPGIAKHAKLMAVWRFNLPSMTESKPRLGHGPMKDITTRHAGYTLGDGHEARPVMQPAGGVGCVHYDVGNMMVFGGDPEFTNLPSAR